jgi:hypothetical protein
MSFIKFANKNNHQITALPQGQLRPNPFHSYRDPKTGCWVVVKKVY